MRTVARLALAVALGVLVSAAAASGAINPKFAVSPGRVLGNQTQTITVAGSASDDPTARLAIYAPLRYSAILNQAAGSTIGTGVATATVRSLAGATVPLTGRVETANPAQFTGPPANECVPGIHTAVWQLVLSAAGNEIRVPVFIDPATGPAASFASYTLIVCLASPSDAQRNPLGAQVTGVSLTLTRVFLNPTTGGE